MKTYIQLLEVKNKGKTTYFEEKKEGKYSRGFVRIKPARYHNLKNAATTLQCLSGWTDKNGVSRYYSTAVYEYQEYFLFCNQQALKINK